MKTVTIMNEVKAKYQIYIYRDHMRNSKINLSGSDFCLLRDFVNYLYERGLCFTEKDNTNE